MWLIRIIFMLETCARTVYRDGVSETLCVGGNLPKTGNPIVCLA